MQVPELGQSKLFGDGMIEFGSRQILAVLLPGFGNDLGTKETLHRASTYFMKTKISRKEIFLPFFFAVFFKP